MASGAESTDDERWLVIDGRRWRRTDPAVPDDLAARLRSHLGRARSAVRTTKRAGDEPGEVDARRRVSLAKHGLGERGPRWWEQEIDVRLARARDALGELDAIAPPRADETPGVNA